MGRIRVLGGRGGKSGHEAWRKDAGSCDETWVGGLPVPSVMIFIFFKIEILGVCS